MLNFSLIFFFIFFACHFIDTALKTLYENFACVHNYSLRENSKTRISESKSIQNVKGFDTFY